ncbi:MAG: L,D-transpeptidase family protein [Patescibacteria group bacterium]
MKKHSFFSYLFWTIIAISAGIIISSSFVVALKTARTYANGFNKPLVYEAKRFPLSVIKEIGKETEKIVTRASRIALGNDLKNESGNKKENGKSITADLDKMIIYLQENGNTVEELPILSKGKSGSPWETPVGKYAVAYKEEKHFSSIGKVWMPNSIQFFGNFFIHGWPYYADGTPVYEGYSGGCIRLSVSDSKKVYDFVENGTPIYVSKQSNSAAFGNESYNTLNDNPQKPTLSSKNYLVADINTGDIILSKDESKQLPIASITKLVTALISLETIDQAKTIFVPKDATTRNGTGKKDLSEGEVISTGSLIYPLLLQSSNIASETLANQIGRQNFINYMNQKTSAIGLNETSFADPSGISEKNISTAEDLLKLLSYLFKNKKHILDITKNKSMKDGMKTWVNNDKLADFENFLGGKTGQTEAARKTFAGIFSLPLSEFEEKNIGIILLQGEDREDDVLKILDYLKNNVYYGTKI